MIITVKAEDRKTDLKGGTIDFFGGGQVDFLEKKKKKTFPGHNFAEILSRTR